MREFSQCIQLIPIGGDITDDFFVMADMPFEINFTSETEEYGVYWNCDKQIVIDTPGSVILRFFSIERKCKVCIWDNSGARYIIGDDHMPAYVHISEGSQNSTLFIRCTLPWNPISQRSFP